MLKQWLIQIVSTDVSVKRRDTLRNTNKFLISKLAEIGEKLENPENELDEIKAELHEIFNAIVEDNNGPAEDGVAYTLEKEKSMETFAESARIRLCKHVEADRTLYIKLQKENTIMPRAFNTDGYEDMLWDDMTEEKAFYTAIRRKEDNAYIGYCGIKNIHKDEMELAIELLKEYHHKGYGSEALRLFMETVYESAGIKTFKALVDGENVASQAMCERIGGLPSGITEHMLHDQQYMLKYEEEYANEITEQLRDVACKFGVEPKKLLTHVLVYRFTV